MGSSPILRLWAKRLGEAFPLEHVGRADILDLCNEADLGQEKYVWFASTLGGNPVTAAASLATLEELRKPGTYEHLFAMGEKLRSGFRALLAEMECSSGIGDGPLCALSFTHEQVIDYRTAFRADRAKGRSFALGLFRNGIFLNPMSTKLYLSLAHGDDEIRAIHSAARKVWKRLRRWIRGSDSTFIASRDGLAWHQLTSSLLALPTG